MTEGLMRVRAEFNLPGDVWNWLVEMYRSRAFASEAEAISFLLTEAKHRHDHARGIHGLAPWPTPQERAAGHAERIG